MKHVGLMVIFWGGLLIGFCPGLPAQTPSASKEANIHYDRGLKYSDQKRYEDAIVEYSRAINLDSRNPTFFRLRAVGQGKKSRSARGPNRLHPGHRTRRELCVGLQRPGEW